MSITYATLPSPSVTVGPLWAQMINNMFTGDAATGAVGLYAHRHEGTDETKIRPAGMNIDADLDFNDNYLTSLGAAQLTAITQPGGSTLLRGLYVAGTDLYFQDGSGTNVRLTQSGAIVPNGTGTANGFYADYSSTVAHASYYNTVGSYQFYKNAVESVRASLVVAGIKSVVSGTNVLYQATAGGDAGNVGTSAKGGWLYSATNSTHLLRNDSGATGTYITARQVASLGDGTSDFSYSINDTTSDTPLSVTKSALSATVKQGSILRVSPSGLGTALTGLGIKQRFWESSESKVISEIQGYFQSKTTSSNGVGGLKLLAAFNGALDTVGIDLVKFSGASAIGLLGAAVSGQGTTAYVQLVPNTSGLALGTSSLRWNLNATTGNFTGDITMDALATIQAQGGINATQTCLFHDIRPSATNTYDLGQSGGNYWRSLYTNSVKLRSGASTQTQGFSGIVHWAAGISSGGSVVYQYTDNNTCTVTKTGTGTYDLDFSTALPATQCLFFGTMAENTAAAGGVVIGQASATKLQVTVRDGVAADKRFNVMILSTGL